MNDLKAAIAAVEESYSQTLTEKFRAAAVEAGWPQEIADLVGILCSEGNAVAHYGGSLNWDRISEWEYGSPKQRAIPILRRWLNTANLTLSDEYFENLASTVWNEVI